MDAVELRQKSSAELQDLLNNLKKEQFNLRFQQASGQLENTSRFRELRRDVARVMTVLNEQSAEAAN